MIKKYYLKALYATRHLIRYYCWKFTGRLPWGRRATIYRHSHCIRILTQSYIAYPTYDPEGAHHYLSLDVSDVDLALTVRDALSKTRYLTNEEAEYYRSLGPYKAHIKDVMNRYKYKSQRALFENASHCTIEMNDGIINIQPWAHVKRDQWDGGNGRITENDVVILPDDCTDAELGRGLRLAFSRCWPKTPWVKQLMAAFEDPAQGA